MVWSDYGSSEEKLDYFGKLERPEQHDCRRLNKAGKHSDEIRNVTSKYTDLDCRVRHSLV